MVLRREPSLRSIEEVLAAVTTSDQETDTNDPGKSGIYKLPLEVPAASFEDLAVATRRIGRFGVIGVTATEFRASETSEGTEEQE